LFSIRKKSFSHSTLFHALQVYILSGSTEKSKHFPASALKAKYTGADSIYKPSEIRDLD
tara:strand:+ start:508 stop:684 length:177 start_codon:yes stop_codon:yes gene_type:complete